MRYEVTIDGTTREVVVEKKKDGRYHVELDGEVVSVDLLRPSPEAWQMLLHEGDDSDGGESWECGCVPAGAGYMVDVRGVSVQVDVVDPRRKALRMSSGASSGTLTTMMPGRVVKLLCAVGDHVKKGQPLLVIEAMKMENELKSPIDGTVAEILVAEGVAVEANTKLVRVTA